MRSFFLATAIAMFLAAAGCRSKQQAQLLYPPVPGRMPSLVFDSPGVDELRLQRSVSGLADSYPWYADRLDRGPIVFRGYDNPEFRAKSVYTWDQQITADGRVHDHFRQTNRHLEIQEQIR